MGGSTASVASEYCKISFVGSGSPLEVAQQFKLILKGRTVCFPISDVSHKSVQRVLPEESVYNVISYQTVKAPTSVPLCDDYLFTSPSNAEAFLEMNLIRESSQIISIGPTTYRLLRDKEIQAIQSKTSTLLGMIDMIR